MKSLVLITSLLASSAVFAQTSGQHPGASNPTTSATTHQAGAFEKAKNAQACKKVEGNWNESKKECTPKQ